jgi:hypothetical protein
MYYKLIGNGGTYSTCILALFDAVDLALRCALATSELHEHQVRPIRFDVESAHAARDIVVRAIAHQIIDRRGTWLLVDNDDRLRVALEHDTVLGGAEVFVAALGSQETDDSEVGARFRHGNGFEFAAPDKSLKLIDIGDFGDAPEKTGTVGRSCNKSV